MLRRETVIVIGLMLGNAGCASPCFDDGLDQGGCPAVGTSGQTTAAESDDASGTAASADSTGATDPSVGTGGAEGYECPEFSDVLVPQIPTFQLVVDRSGSMDDDFGGVSRWDALVDTLVGTEGVVIELQSQIRFGMTLYSNEGGTCPTIDSIAPQLDAADELTTMFAGTGPMGDTPTGESVVIATALVVEDPWDGEKVLVLATDGSPDTCAVPEPVTDQEFEEARNVSIDAVTAAYEAGIRTFVISVGSDLALDHVQDLANAGAGAQAGESTPYWVANDTAGLVAAFDAIVAGIRPCTFDLETPLMAEVAGSCEVTVNGEVLEYQGQDGWTLADENTLELTGDGCAAIQEGVAVVAMSCTCEAQ